jgi:quinoprotein glucose dehydrogenase
MRWTLAFAAFSLLAQDASWPTAGGSPAGIRYSPLTQITRANVAQLRPAWTFDTGDAFPGSEMQCQPIVVGGTLYATTPKLHVIALHAATGKLIWRFDPHDGAPVKSAFRNRGVVYWRGGRDERIFVTVQHRLLALDARTGQPIRTFGQNGAVDLRDGLGRDPKTLNVIATSPGIIYRDLLIQGSLVPEALPSAPGDIRAYDVRTGALRWTFHTIPRPGEPGYETWPPGAHTYTGGVNTWAGLALDERRGIVYAPTGSASFDFYGANRHGDNLYANCLLALDARTGRRLWHFQTVKHDVWDRDLPSPPSLVTVTRDGRPVDAIAQPSKAGYIWLFDRVTGKPLFPMEERRVPASDVEGEQLAATQWIPTKPTPFARQEFSEDLVTDRTPDAHRIVLERWKQVRSGPQFTPPSLQGTIIFPGFDGGAEWGGSAFDPATGLFYVNANEMPWILRLVPRGSQVNGQRLYQGQCAGCHRDDMGGSPPAFPSLVGIGKRLSRAELEKIIRQGVGRMPGFNHLGDESVRAMVRLLASGENSSVTPAATPSPFQLKFHIDGYNRFLDPEGYPAVKPPWGTLNAINLHTGEYAWRIPLGEYPKLDRKDTGSENYGGPVVTAGGLVFIAATNFDQKFRAFDKDNGRLLWQAALPASGNATPAVYAVGGKQYVVIAAGGGKSGAPSGGTYVAFALP